MKFEIALDFFLIIPFLRLTTKYNNKFMVHQWILPMLSLFAEIFMDDLENYCFLILEKDFNCIPLFYYRYVDDTILCVLQKHISKTTSNKNFV